MVSHERVYIYIYVCVCVCVYVSRVLKVMGFLFILGGIEVGARFRRIKFLMTRESFRFLFCRREDFGGKVCMDARPRDSICFFLFVCAKLICEILLLILIYFEMNFRDCNLLSTRKY